MRSSWEKVPFEKAEGGISAEYIFAYPPGVPLLIPGQEITEEVLGLLGRYEAQGIPLKTDPYSDCDGKLLKVDTYA